MTKIRQGEFASRIEEYILDPACFNEERFGSSLYTVITERQEENPATGDVASIIKTLHGLCFSEYIELVMILLNQAYCGLDDSTSLKKYSTAMSAAMQDFAEPLENGSSACYPGPYFLLHGIDQHTLDDCVTQFKSNGRIIHETLAARDSFLDKYGGGMCLENGIKMYMEEGSAEDFFGICCYITSEDEKNPHGTDSSYIAKVSFFLDTLRREIIVITLQGQRVLAGQKKRSRAYARLAAKLGMDPRGYVLEEVCKIAKDELYRRVRIIRPEHHPMFLDEHPGFMARYEPVILVAGITKENGCYLESSL